MWRATQNCVVEPCLGLVDVNLCCVCSDWAVLGQQIEPVTLSLLRTMLDPQWRTRVTAARALCHPYFGDPEFQAWTGRQTARFRSWAAQQH
jgi:hypothetical protein